VAETFHALALPAFHPGMRIGLFGGSFDPPHHGHLAVTLAGLRALRLDAVWWLVSPHNPLKPADPSADLRERTAAAEALAADPRIRVTAVEAALGTRYTAETLAVLLPRLAGAHPVWMMGADSLRTFHRWRDWQSIAAAVPIAVFNRPGEALKALASPAAHALGRYRLPERLAATLADRRPPAWVFLSRPSVAISSTELRAGRRALS
jgi:nicotinate-nucleotide adenylyltransferase